MWTLQFLLATFACLWVGLIFLHMLPRLGAPGKKLVDACCRAPLVDVVVFYFTMLPPIAGVVLALNCPGGHTRRTVAAFFAGILAQSLTLITYSLVHGFWQRMKEKNPPRIWKTLDKLVGTWRNHFAVWWTMLALPVFGLVRFAEYFVYPPLTWTVRLPKYDSSKWVMVSRHKFEGLVGYDRLWCLYCDWMTGVWSLGSEMLRNVESFWCPIRFSSPEKCENCKFDFPDVKSDWVPADQNVGKVINLLEQKYPRPEGNSWFGHPDRKDEKK